MLNSDATTDDAGSSCSTTGSCAAAATAHSVGDAPLRMTVDNAATDGRTIINCFCAVAGWKWTRKGGAAADYNRRVGCSVLDQGAYRFVSQGSASHSVTPIPPVEQAIEESLSYRVAFAGE